MEQARKECILNAAVKAFNRFGFKKASVDEIAKEAGVAKGTVYLAAENKEDLFYQALHREVREWVAENSKLIDPRVPADQMLQVLARMAMDQIEVKPMVRGLISGEYARLLPTWSARFDELRALCAGNVQEILKLGIRQGRFRPDIDVEGIGGLLIDLQISTLLFHNAPGPDREARLDRRAAAAFDLIFRGLRPDGAPAENTRPAPKQPQSHPHS